MVKRSCIMENLGVNMFNNAYRGKTILITGGSGSIGSILTQTLLKYPVKSFLINVICKFENIINKIIINLNLKNWTSLETAKSRIKAVNE